MYNLSLSYKLINGIEKNDEGNENIAAGAKHIIYCWKRVLLDLHQIPPFAILHSNETCNSA